MANWTPDPTFYPSPRMAMDAEPEKLAYVAMLNVADDPAPDAMGVVDVDPNSATYGHLIGRTPMPGVGDELHHFGWNACSSALCPYAPHPHIERRYLVVPGLRSSRIHILDTKETPRAPRLVKTVEAEELAYRAGYSRPHTLHCGPEGIYVSAIGAADGGGPGGVFLMDHETFDVRGQWEVDRGEQYFAYDLWWHLGHDTMVTSEWGTPDMIEQGVDPELLLGGKYGRRLHFWDMRKRRNIQTVDLGAEQQLVLELRPAHDPRKAYGFAGVVLSLEDLSSSIWLWFHEDGEWKVEKVITIPAEPADPDRLPPLLKGFEAAAPLLTDIDLSLDDRFLYASCWGTGELKQFDVSDPHNPRETGSVRLGGMVGRSPHPASGKPLNGGPQMVEISRDANRIYLTNSLYRAWDDQFYPDGIESWMVKLHAGKDGGLEIDPNFFLEFDSDFRAHQVRLQGGDASSDSYCFS